jgi:hypothetical protein
MASKIVTANPSLKAAPFIIDAPFGSESIMDRLEHNPVYDQWLMFKGMVSD